MVTQEYVARKKVMGQTATLDFMACLWGQGEGNDWHQRSPSEIQTTILQLQGMCLKIAQGHPCL